MYQSTIYRPNGKLSAPMRLVTMKPTSVIIMDTHPIIRMSIEVLLQKNSELQIVLKTDDYRITSESVIFIIEIRMLLCWQSDTSWC